jgi:hypothetical protein
LVLELLELEIQRSAARVAEEGVAAAPLAVAARAAVARKGGESLTDRQVGYRYGVLGALVPCGAGCSRGSTVGLKYGSRSMFKLVVRGGSMMKTDLKL